MTHQTDRELIQHLVNELQGYRVAHPDHEMPALEAGRIRLAQPEPEGPKRDELIELACDHGVSAQDIGPLVATVLARFTRPTIQPVPVAERPWEREGWCDAEGVCWWFHKETPHTNAGWIPATHEDVELVGTEFFSHSLPHHALPIPTLTQPTPAP